MGSSFINYLIFFFCLEIAQIRLSMSTISSKSTEVNSASNVIITTSSLSPRKHDCNLTKVPSAIRCQGADWKEVCELSNIKSPPRIKSVSFVDGRFENDVLCGSTFAAMTLNFSATRYLDIRRNGLRLIKKDAFKSFSRLIELLLDDNPIETFLFGSLIPLSNSLQTLSLQNISRSRSINDLKMMFQDDVIGDVNVQELSKLQVLDLTNNGIEEVDTHFFVSMINFEVFEKLILDHNRLKSFSFIDLLNTTLQQRRSVKNPFILQVRYNFVTSISNDAEKLLHLNNTQGQLQLYLEGNPFNCNCSLESFSKFLQTSESHSRLGDLNLLICSKPNELLSKTVREAISLMLKVCGDKKEWETVKTVLLGFFLFLLALVTLTVGYLHRKKIILKWRAVTQCARASDSPNHKNGEDFWWESRTYINSSQQVKGEAV